MLLERDSELGLMDGLLGEVESSGGKVILIRGEAGIGKSSLVREFIDRHSGEASIYFGSCDDLLITQPLAPFWDIARGEPSIAEPLYAANRPGVLGATLDMLSRSLRASIVVLEDTHWADEATLDAIKYLGRRIARTNGLLLLTYRDGEVDYDHPLRRVIGDLPPESVVRIQLRGLSLSAVASIVGESELDASEVMAATNGNPFLATEMASAGGERVPASLQDSVFARVQKLSTGAREILKTLSVIPEPIPRGDAVRLRRGSDSNVDECVQRGLLDIDGDFIAFRHDLIRRTVESSLTTTERMTANRTVLESLPEETHPCLLIHVAREAGDVDRLIDLAPRSARFAARVGSHRQAVEDFRELAPHLSHLPPVELGPILDEWADEEFLVDDIVGAIDVNELALHHYRELGDNPAESRALARAAHFYENAGQREQAERVAQQAVNVLGADPDGADLAGALEANAYLAMMEGNVATVPELVDRTLEVGGSDIDDGILIRSLNHRGIVANIANYPEGRSSLDEARDRSEAAGQWYEECRALLNHAWAAAEFRDLPIASDYAQRAIASAVRHELEGLEGYSTAIYARVLELKGKWCEAEDLARALLASSAITQMIALPVLGAIEARRGRGDAGAMLSQAWEMSLTADEFQRLAPTAAAVAEHAWITGSEDVHVGDIKRIMEAGLDSGFKWSTGALAFWLWKLGELAHTPRGIAEPYRLSIEGESLAAAEMWATIGCPYERSLALTHGDPAAQAEAVEMLETLGATAVAAKQRKAMRAEGHFVPRGKGRVTRGHAGGLTARQAEVLQLLDEGLSNIEIADRLFVSPRTVEHHVSAILAKLDSSTREEAVTLARSEGFLTP
ncbi:MAG: LuxR C-terminal-related transcriptional regulator [Thermodesulfobacteriota bacterium]|nr:LuxR C-terminal-related transcriptional regulator [Thermodesulfobacteriota bacterium]